jgi:hypothetical protein
VPEGNHDARKTERGASHFLRLSDTYVMYRGVTPLHTSVRHPRGSGGSWVTPGFSNYYRKELPLRWLNQQVQPDKTPPLAQHEYCVDVRCEYKSWYFSLHDRKKYCDSERDVWYASCVKLVVGTSHISGHLLIPAMVITFVACTRGWPGVPHTTTDKWKIFKWTTTLQRLKLTYIVFKDPVRTALWTQSSIITSSKVMQHGEISACYVVKSVNITDISSGEKFILFKY